MSDHSPIYRVTPIRGVFRVEAVTANGAIEALATWPTEDQAVRHLRELQQIAERIALQGLAAEESPRGPRGRPLVTAVPAASMWAAP
jgi:hypothetical protein